MNISIHQNRGILKRAGAALKMLFNKDVKNGLYDPILVNNKDLGRMYRICERISEDTEPVAEMAIANEKYRLMFFIDKSDFHRIYIEVHQNYSLSPLRKICLVCYYVLRFKRKYDVEKFNINAQEASYLKGLLGYTHLLAKDLE